MTRYLPAKHYLWLGAAAVVFAGSVRMVRDWSFALAFIPAALFLLTAVFLFAMALRPAIEIHEGYLSIGKQIMPWMDIRRLDRTGWISPLIVRITLFDDSRLLLVYPGDLDSCNSLLRHLRRLSRDALIDGIPYRQYWGEVLAAGGERKQARPAPLPHPAARRRGRGRASLPAAENRRESRSEELHGREVVACAPRSPGRLTPHLPFCLAAIFAPRLAAARRALSSTTTVPRKADIAVVLAGDTVGPSHRESGRTRQAGLRARGARQRAGDSTAMHESDAGDRLRGEAGLSGGVVRRRCPIPLFPPARRPASCLPELQRRNVHSFLLVTSDYHTARAGADLPRRRSARWAAARRCASWPRPTSTSTPIPGGNRARG